MRIIREQRETTCSGFKGKFPSRSHIARVESAGFSRTALKLDVVETGR
jgi:hypothetical protein